MKSGIKHDIFFLSIFWRFKMFPLKVCVFCGEDEPIWKPGRKIVFGFKQAERTSKSITGGFPMTFHRNFLQCSPEIVSSTVPLLYTLHWECHSNFKRKNWHQDWPWRRFTPGESNLQVRLVGRISFANSEQIVLQCRCRAGRMFNTAVACLIFYIGIQILIVKNLREVGDHRLKLLGTH
jgi:hypothetical protein